MIGRDIEALCSITNFLENYYEYFKESSRFHSPLLLQTSTKARKYGPEWNDFTILDSTCDCNAYVELQINALKRPLRHGVIINYASVFCGDIPVDIIFISLLATRHRIILNPSLMSLSIRSRWEMKRFDIFWRWQFVWMGHASITRHAGLIISIPTTNWLHLILNLSMYSFV